MHMEAICDIWSFTKLCVCIQRHVTPYVLTADFPKKFMILRGAKF